ncbi:hypothetical protein DAI22_08g057050 [Oryza sativa Japonica Group]|nr:hypothetical protein DAI22_08g057050 [Oryza sativa Japonica Group]
MALISSVAEEASGRPLVPFVHRRALHHLVPGSTSWQCKLNHPWS